MLKETRKRIYPSNQNVYKSYKFYTTVKIIFSRIFNSTCSRKRIYLQGRNRHTDVENRCVNMRQRRKGNDELGGGIDIYTQGLPLWLSWERICLQCGRPRFDPRVGKIPWRRERLPTPVFWPGEFHGVYSLWDCKESGVAFISQSCIYTLSQSVSSVAQSFPTLCGPMNRSTPGLLVHHQLPEFTQIHAH